MNVQFVGCLGNKSYLCSVIVWLFSCLHTPTLQGEVIAQLDKDLIKTDCKFLLWPL